MNNKSENNNHAPEITLTDEQRKAFIKSMKIGYYRVFYKRGLITGEQLEMLIEMNTVRKENAADKNTDNNGNNSPAA